MNVDEMEAGRELDATVALEVMGWKRHEWREHRALQHTVFCPKCGNTKAKVALSDFYEFCGTALLPRYSTDIAAAWEVVEKLSGDCIVRVSNGDGDSRDCDILPFSADGVYRPAHVTANAWELAICRAALKALEVKE